MEEFFDLNAMDDVDDDNPMSQQQKIDFYNRRDSKAHPNHRSQSMADKIKEGEFLNS